MDAAQASTQPCGDCAAVVPERGNGLCANCRGAGNSYGFQSTLTGATGKCHVCQGTGICQGCGGLGVVAISNASRGGALAGLNGAPRGWGRLRRDLGRFLGIR
jgi:hypothetical protein